MQPAQHVSGGRARPLPSGIADILVSGARSLPVVGVPASLTRLSPITSVGRIWSRGLAELDKLLPLRVVDDPARRWPRRPRVDVWICDGHQGALEVRAPVVAHLHEASWAAPGLRELLEPAFVERFEALSAQGAATAARVLTVSQSSKDQIVEAYGIAADCVHIAPNGVDHQIYRPDLAAPDDLLRAAGGDPSMPYVLFVSVIHPRKNLDSLREALAQLATEGLPHALVLVGNQAIDRVDAAELAAAALRPIPGVEQPPVNLAGASDEEVARLMGGAAAFCLPSLMEGFGMAVAEAMACGAPVVVADRGSLPEVVGDAGVVTAPDADSLASGLREILRSPERQAQLRTAALRRAARYTWPAMAKAWAEALCAAVDQR